MRALVLGGTRFFGYHVLVELRRRGHEVAVVDFEDPDPLRKPVELSPGVALHYLSRDLVMNPDAIRLPVSCGDFDVVFACGEDPYPGDAGPASADVLAADRVLLERALADGPAAVVLTSSAAVLEDGEGIADHLREVESAVRSRAPRAAILRCGIVIGSGPVVAARGRAPKLTYLIPGVQVDHARYPQMTLRVDTPSPEVRLADFVSVEDAAAAHVDTAEWLVTRDPGLHVFDVGTGVAPDIGEVVRAAGEGDNLELEGADALAAPFAGAELLDTRAIEDAVGWRATSTDYATYANEARFYRTWVFGGQKVGLDVRVGHEFLGSSLSRDHLTIWGFLIARDKTGLMRNEDLRFELHGEVYEARIATRRGIRVPLKYIRVSPYVLRIPREALAGLGLQNPLRLVYVDRDGGWFRRRLRYSFLRGEPSNRRSRLFRLPESGSVLYLRQTDDNRLTVTVRGPNVTDSRAMRLKVRLAWLASKIVPRRSVVLYEKESRNYEESGSVVYEEMVERGRHDAVFILAEEMLPKVPERYRKQVVTRFSFRHFYHFFCAATFIGTETVFSAAELRSSDRLLMNRISRHRYRFAFLQHGVMYMVALSSRQRRFFRAGEVFPLGTKIVVSSEREARHFVDLGGFDPGDLYVCGLPKFDHAVRDADADRILIMPTWRPWEHNIIRTDPESVPYYQMVHEMYDAVPDELKPNVVILPHPLVKDVLAKTDLGDRMWDGDSYDAALRRCSVLITDYSSIAYDAFYRGGNVVFWWKEKEYCMQQYGGHLMIDESTAFGPVCYDSPALGRAVTETHLTAQDPEFVRRYREIVEFHDGRNTERLLGFMEQDGLI